MAVRQDVGLSVDPARARCRRRRSCSGVIVARMVPAFQLMQERIDQINRVLREQITGIRVVRAFVREPQETRRFEQANAELTDDVAARRAADVVDVPDREPPHQPVERRRRCGSAPTAVASGEHRGRHARRLPELPRPDPVVGRDGHVHGVDDPDGRRCPAERIQEVLDTESARRAAGRPRARRPRATGQLELATSGSTTRAPSSRARATSRSRPAPGTTTAIIGSTGAGKTTLVNLVPRLFDATSGPVLVGGVDVRELDPDVLWSTHRPRAAEAVPVLAAPSPATCATASPTPPRTRCGRPSRSPRPTDFVRAMPGGLEARDRAGRHQRLGRPAPAAVDRPGAGPQARDLRLRRLVLRPRPRHRRPAAGRAARRTPRTPRW